jgi:hypothetical protein
MLGILLVAAGVLAGLLELGRDPAPAVDSAPRPLVRPRPVASRQSETADANVELAAVFVGPPIPVSAVRSEAGAADAADAADAVTPALEADPTAQPELTFTVAVSPLELETDDQKAEIAFTYIYDKLLFELSLDPRLVLIELVEADQADEPQESDFLLTFKARTSVETIPTESEEAMLTVLDEPMPVWSFTVNWFATRGGNGSWVASEVAPQPREIDGIPQEAVAALRRYPFPPDATRTSVLESLVLDTLSPFDERLEALDELKLIPKRYAFVGRDEQRLVATAAANIVINSYEPEIRGRVWKAMSDLEDPYLIGPLFDSLLTDASDYVRLEAIKLLAANFSDDSRAMAALEYAVLNDLSPQVRAYALWEALDEEGRWEYVASTLQNEALSNTERLELVAADVRDLNNYIDDDSVGALVRFAGAGPASPAQLASAADPGPPDPAFVIPALLQVLNEHANAQIRSTVASALVPHLGDAAVYAAMTRAARSDPSFSVRALVDSALRRWESEHEAQ